MFIYVPELKAQLGDAVDYNFSEDLSICFDDYNEGDHLKLMISAQCSGDKILVSGTVEVSVKTSCSRCLRQFNNQFKTDFRESFTVLNKPDPVDSKDDLAHEAANSLTISGDHFYLDEYIRQMVIIAQEYNPLCKPDCKGICAGCGVDLNQAHCRCANAEEPTDIRLLKLKELISGS